MGEKTMKNHSVKTKGKGVSKDLILLLPILFLTTVFLFCIRGCVVPNYFEDLHWGSPGAYFVDLYSYFRMQIFVAVTILFSLYLVFCLVTGSVKINKHKAYIPMLIYVVMVVVSYLFSEYKQVAFLGDFERYEGTLTLIAYMLILFYTMQVIRNEAAIRLILKCFVVSCVLLGIWGILQVLGVRLDMIPQFLYIPAKLRGMVNMTKSMNTSAVTWFFTNQNYTSFFMVFPICLFGMCCIAEEDMKKKVLFAVLTGLMMFCLWRAASLGGMVGLAVAGVAALLIAGGKNIVKWRKSLGILALAAVISIGASLPVIMNEMKNGVPVSEKGSMEFVKLEHITTEGKDIVFGFEGNEVRIITENGLLEKVVDASGKELAVDNPLLQVSSYQDEETKYDVIQAKTANRTWHFVVQNGQSLYVTDSGKGIKLGPTESIGFVNSQGFATNRGYIWSRTLPLLKDTLLFGHGADTFVLYFPQEDFAGRYNISYYTDSGNHMFDKPHNMYLGWAVNTGVVSMVALVAVFLLYLAESVKTYRKRQFEGFAEYIGMGIFIATAGFMVSGLVNDTTIQMMPLVYVFLGMGFSINRMLQKKPRE